MLCFTYLIFNAKHVFDRYILNINIYDRHCHKDIFIKTFSTDISNCYIFNKMHILNRHIIDMHIYDRHFHKDIFNRQFSNCYIFNKMLFDRHILNRNIIGIHIYVEGVTLVLPSRLFMFNKYWRILALS